MCAIDPISIAHRLRRCVCAIIDNSPREKPIAQRMRNWVYSHGASIAQRNCANSQNPLSSSRFPKAHPSQANFGRHCASTYDARRKNL